MTVELWLLQESCRGKKGILIGISQLVGNKENPELRNPVHLLFVPAHLRPIRYLPFTILSKNKAGVR